MNRIETDIYPTRYTAFENPGNWAVFTPTNGTYRSCTADGSRLPREVLGAGLTYPGEMAVLCLNVPSKEYPDLFHGFYIEVGGIKGPHEVTWPSRKLPKHWEGYTAICHYTAPDKKRSQKNARLKADSRDEAMRLAEEWIKSIAS